MRKGATKSLFYHFHARLLGVMKSDPEDIAEWKDTLPGWHNEREKQPNNEAFDVEPWDFPTANRTNQSLWK